MNTSQTREEMQQRRFDGSNIVFLVGSPRSGTTFLQRMLAGLPGVHSGQESHFFSGAGPLLSFFDGALDQNRPCGPGCYMSAERWRAMVGRFTDEFLEAMLCDVGPDEVFLEKSPAHALVLPQIRELLPRARVIHLLRDGRDVVASTLAASRGWGASWAPSDIHKAIYMWTNYVQTTRSAQKLWPENEFLEVRYEALLRDPLPALRACAQLLNVEANDEILNAVIATNRAEVARESGGTPIVLRGEAAARSGETTPVLREPSGFVRRAQIGSWKRDLTLLEKIRVRRHAGRLLRECGYR